MIMVENYKFGYKLVNKTLPTKTQQLCYLDNKNESLKKKYQYNTRNKELPNLPKHMNIRLQRQFSMYWTPKLPNITGRNKVKTILKMFHQVM